MITSFSDLIDQCKRYKSIWKRWPRKVFLSEDIINNLIDKSTKARGVRVNTSRSADYKKSNPYEFYFKPTRLRVRCLVINIGVAEDIKNFSMW